MKAFAAAYLLAIFLVALPVLSAPLPEIADSNAVLLKREPSAVHAHGQHTIQVTAGEKVKVEPSTKNVEHPQAETDPKPEAKAPAKRSNLFSRDDNMLERRNFLSKAFHFAKGLIGL
ncbi:SubName: Full=Uncharacterized protein {ECO:0000313/EMBL:CCA70280.1} [Serendipita indica DSM 11827]|uniref:Uncharacterized protein n=1 Tax=Serendipita indica (strain DSM 11827) TaxID=1109443 RepID=G4TG22_SERID|nr:SubName: Full=Uncharacterized protein {ECO:0000313/EMBL:CCA70280.1} [Serendipita indica DSM 11827]CCA70280.1 hypothetical protein PIIN_04219 [Serendipita indica DSM 11827]